ncbi:hypothetical protein [Mycobacterium sp.]|uniref:hypothetical protein n=1 Tax=Mycobacterium sp. TaxID=1785 RepID=UPI002D8705A7|nr:hypothetical protein [Mycobacterium sp.]
MSADERVFWRSDSCCVWVGYDDGGRLVFNGVDREHLDGYEYSIAVAPDQFDKLRGAFDADAAVDVVDLVCEHVDDIMSRGERTWLDERGIENAFNCQ